VRRGRDAGENCPYRAVQLGRRRQKLLFGTYRPQQVRDTTPKPGGTRTLGIPTGLDRFIQQCLLRYEPQF